MNHIFISYQRSSEKQTTRFAERLRAEGMEIWQDLSGKETGIPYSVKWWEVIEDALYSALGSIIVHTAAWRDSTPCKEEFKLINDNKMPKLEVTEEEFGDMDRLVDKVKTWYSKEVNTAENRDRAYLFSQGYRYGKDGSISRLLPGKTKLSAVYTRYKRFLELSKTLEERRYTENNPKADVWIRSFLSKAKRKLLTEQLIRLTFVILGALGVLVLYTAVQLLPHLEKSASRSSTANDAAAKLSLIMELGQSDPVYALALLQSSEENGIYPVGETFRQMQSAMTSLLEQQYPVRFYPAGSETAMRLREMETPVFPVSCSRIGGQALISVDGTETVLTVACIPTAYCFVPVRNELLLAADNVVYAYDLDRTMQPIPLVYNYETIEKIVCDAGLVCGVTVKGNVICWDNPIAPKTSHLHLEEGFVLENGGAAFIDGERLIINRPESSRSFELPGQNPVTFAVSHDEAQAAVVLADGSANVRALLLDINTGESHGEYALPAETRSLAFSGDDRLLFAVSPDQLCRIDPETGKAISLKAENRKYMSVLASADRIIVSDSDGMAAEFSADLTQLSAWMEATPSLLPPKQLAFSEKYRSLFTANRGGNRVSGCRCVDLATGAVRHLAVQPEAGLLSNLSTAVSEDGEFVAFGYPNGRIAVWSVRSLHCLVRDRAAAEAIIAVRFGAQCVYGLGTSGTVYTFDFDGLVRPVEENNSKEYWAAYLLKAKQIHERLFALKLTAIEVEP